MCIIKFPITRTTKLGGRGVAAIAYTRYVPVSRPITCVSQIIAVAMSGITVERSI